MVLSAPSEPRPAPYAGFTGAPVVVSERLTPYPGFAPDYVPPPSPPRPPPYAGHAPPQPLPEPSTEPPMLTRAPR